MAPGRGEGDIDFMRITREDLARAAESGVLTAGQAESLWQYLSERAEARPRFDAAHVLWYGGALIVMSSLTLFTTIAWRTFGGLALALTGAAYGLGGWALGAWLRRRGLATPGGLLIAIAVALVPLTVFGLQEAFGWLVFTEPGSYADYLSFSVSDWLRGGFVPSELAVILAGVLAYRRYRFDFIVVPVAVAAWFLSMDLTPALLGADGYDSDIAHRVSLVFGLGMIVLAWILDIRGAGGPAFWLHIGGGFTFWIAVPLVLLDFPIGDDPRAGIFGLVSLALIALSVFLARPSYAVFGGLGVALYLGYLADEVFGDSILFPFALSALGLSVIAAGVIVVRHRAAIAAWVDRTMPEALRVLRPAHARVRTKAQ